MNSTRFAIVPLPGGLYREAPNRPLQTVTIPVCRQALGRPVSSILVLLVSPLHGVGSNYRSNPGPGSLLQTRTSHNRSSVQSTYEDTRNKDLHIARRITLLF